MLRGQLDRLHVEQVEGRQRDQAPFRPELQPAVEQVLSGLALLRLDDALLDTAGRLAPVGLRSLEAVHLASALRLPALTAVIAYDERLLAAARALRLPVLTPT